jgi:N utilization substance protein B
MAVGSASAGARQRDRKVGKRRTAREIALQMLYQRELGGTDLAAIFAAFDAGEYVACHREPGGAAEGGRALQRVVEALPYAQELVRGTVAHLEEIDGLIRVQAANWRLERMPVVDRNVLRLAVYELLFETDIPKLVVMDEAIELAKKFGSEQSGRFVNGLLDGLLKRHQ